MSGPIVVNVTEEDIREGEAGECFRCAVAKALQRATGAKLVLSSAWRYIVHRGEANLMGMEWLLRSHGVLADRLIGITAPDTMERGVYRGEPGTWPVANERGAQITRWLMDDNRWTGQPYAVVDDLDLGISAAEHPFVQTDGAVGLTEADADRLIEMLGAISQRTEAVA